MALPRLAASSLRRVRRSTLPAVVISLAIALVAVACRDMITTSTLRPPEGAPARVLASSPSISFSDFTGAVLNLQGSAETTGSPGVLRLTPAVDDQTGSAWYPQKQALAQGFSTTFTFSIQGGSGADGFAFVVQSAGANAIQLPTGSCGSCLGYDGMPQSLAVEFDTYGDDDAGGQHLAVHSKGAAPNSIQSDGRIGSVGIPTTSLRGGLHTATLRYTPATPAAGALLLVYLDGSTSPLVSVPVDLAASGVLDANGEAWVGFTGATGQLTDQHDIHSWSLTPSAAVYGLSVLVTDPDPAAGVLVTATDISSGEPLYQRTGEDGQAHFALLAGRYVFSARRVATTDPDQLQVWPFAGGEVPVSGELGAFAGAVYVGGEGSQILTPDNYHRAFRSPLDLNATSFAELGGRITLSLTPTATIGCTLLDADGSPIQGSGAQVFGTLPYDDTSDLPPLPESFTGNRDLPRGLGYGVANVSDDGSCALPGAPEGITVLETPPIQTPDGPVVYRTAVDVSESDAQDGSTVQTVVGPQPQLWFTNYFTGEPWGDERGGNDIGGLITFGWKDATTSTFVVTSGFRGLGTYSLELFTSDPGADVEPKDAAVRVSVVCSAKRCKMLPRAPKPPNGTTATGVSVFHGGDSQGTLVWQVPLPGNPDTIWLRITTSGKSDRGDQTVVLPAVRQPGDGNSYVIMAGS